MKVTFVEDNGLVQEIEDAKPGQTLMEVGRGFGVEGILADCGGACACATCHVYVDEEWFEKVGPPDEVEAEMLDMVAEDARPTSRLSCQIKLTEALDGIKVTVAPTF